MKQCNVTIFMMKKWFIQTIGHCNHSPLLGDCDLPANVAVSSLSLLSEQYHAQAMIKNIHTLITDLLLFQRM